LKHFFVFVWPQFSAARMFHDFMKKSRSLFFVEARIWRKIILSRRRRHRRHRRRRREWWWFIHACADFNLAFFSNVSFRDQSYLL